MNRPAPRARAAYFVAVAVCCAALVYRLPHVPQPQSFHRFVDTRSLLGIPNFADTATNLPFLLIGVLGLPRIRSIVATTFERFLWGAFFAGLVLTAFGSTWYHLAPSNERLVWDRAPLSIVCAALLTIAIADRLGEAASRWGALPVFALSIGSVFYWAATDDLRWWGFAQFFPAVAIPLLALLAPPRYTKSAAYFVALGCYAAAKLFELFDRETFEMTGFVGGHALKHLSAAAAAWVLYRMAVTRALSDPRIGR